MTIKAKKTVVSADNKDEIEELKEEIETMKEVHTVIRVITDRPNPVMGAYSVAQVDEYLGGMLADGWKILSAQFLGEIPEGYKFAWTLVR